MGHLHGRLHQLLPLTLLAAALASGPLRAAHQFELLGLSPEERAALVAACGSEPVCAARRLSRSDPLRFTLEPAAAPDTEVIRWVRKRPSLAAVERAGELLRVELTGFSRTLFREWRRRVPAGAEILLDLRRHRGGDVERMLDLASSLSGQPEELWLVSPSARRRLVARPGAVPRARVRALLVGPETASAAEALALLLARRGAVLCGMPSRGKWQAEALVPVSGELVLRARVGVLWPGGRPPPPRLRPERSDPLCRTLAPVAKSASHPLKGG